MGRKIRGAKHHGVKDPLKQQEQRMKSLKNKINAPPTHPDDQPIPKSLTRLFDYKTKHEQRVTKKKNMEKLPVIQHRGDGERKSNPMSTLSRLPGESGRSFNLRINSMLHSINSRQQHIHELDKSLNPDSYMHQDDVKEERFDAIQKKKEKRKVKEEKKRKLDGAGEASTKLSRMQRWTLKKKEKKVEKLEEREEASEPQYDRVRFGEVAHEPPSLHIKPRKALAPDGAARPGRRNLLLSKLLDGNTESLEIKRMDPKITVESKTTNTMNMDKKGKRKTLPVGIRMRLEQSQKEAIEAYRALKTKLSKSKNE